jgi:membrane-associated phospholipid phosphatase
MDSRLIRPLLAACAGVAALAAVLVCAYFLAPVERWDASALHGLRTLAYNHETLASLARIAHLGDAAIIVPATAVVCVGALAAGRRREALAAALIVAGAAAVTVSLKALLAHPRHQPTLGSLHLPDDAFPSGHATMVMALALAAVTAAPSRWRRAVALVAAALTVIVSTALVADGWHYPSDVLGGYLVSVSVTLLVLAAMRAAPARERSAPARTRAALAPLGIQAAGLLVAAAGTALALLAFTHPSGLVSFSAANTSAVVAAVALASLSVGLVHALTAELEAA